MQLAILLSLILTRGPSLPDKRTALYDSYVELFFNRESEKSAIVRENRELLIDIHRYLAWLLHSESELGNSRGSISAERLHEVLEAYLKSEAQDTKLGGKLFTGMVERVVALVSRVEGTFEFEVQPLREYFAARHLYDTAPYSPPGGERRGTKPDRFDAIARNLYWTNVARFYAGCFSKGELPALVERLHELSTDKMFKYSGHPRRLAAMLLGDWVFSQNLNSVKQAVEILLDGIGLRYLLAADLTSARRRGMYAVLSLPQKCGGEEIVAKCFKCLLTKQAPDYASELIELARANATNFEEIAQRWIDGAQHRKVSMREWLSYGLELGVLSKVNVKTLLDIVGSESNVPIDIMFRARRLDIIESRPLLLKRGWEGVLSRELVARSSRRADSVLDCFAHAVDVNRYTSSFRERSPFPLRKLVRQAGLAEPQMAERPIASAPNNDESYLSYTQFAAHAEKLCERSAAEWATELDPWDELVEDGRKRFGERWVFTYLANCAAAIRSNKEQCGEFSDLLNHAASLCRRARYARLRSNKPVWWGKQFELISDDYDAELLSFVFLTWARPGTLVALNKKLDKVLCKLNDTSWRRIVRGVLHILDAAHLRRDERCGKIDVMSLSSTISARTAAVLMIRADGDSSRALYKRYLTQIKTDDDIVLEQIAGEALGSDGLEKGEWKPDLDKVRQCYAAGTLAVRRPWAYRHVEDAMSLSLAQRIAEEPTSYPGYLVALAEGKCTQEAVRQVLPVGEIAVAEGWFV